MYRPLTIRRMKDLDTRNLMKTCNQFELVLRALKRQVKDKQIRQIALKKAFYDPSQKHIDELFGKE